MQFSGSKRAFVSLLVLMSFLVILITSVLMFTQKHSTSVALIHTIFGFGLVLVVVFHFKNNFNMIKQHLKLRLDSKARAAGFNGSLLFSVIIFLVVMGLSYVNFSPFVNFYQWGASLRASKLANETSELNYLVVNKQIASARGQNLRIDLRKGRAYSWPQMAIWLETLDGEFIQPIFVSETLAKSNFVARINKRDDSVVFTDNPLRGDDTNFDRFFTFDDSKTEADGIIRPESLPVFLHQIGNKLTNGHFAEKNNENLADAYTGATLNQHFIINTRAKKQLPKKFKVRLEVNQSFDFNEYYSSDRFPEDPIYSGNGFNGQPSVIYESIVDQEQSPTIFVMKRLGHSHHSGQNGNIYQDSKNLTTALQIIDRVIVELR